MAAAPNPRHGYPRPQLERESWTSLNGPWEFAIDERATWTTPEVQWSGEILVPFAPETSESGVAHAALFGACWYRRTFDAPALCEGERLLLHFGEFSTFEELRARLADGVAMERMRANVRRHRDCFTFDAHADVLCGFFRRVIDASRAVNEPGRPRGAAAGGA